ncbi:UDP-N-acetylmuramoyl-tripeptide--D-alanyl-D-alanine ligase [Thermoleptolyngbya sp. C42_A2020_037]|uniref:UDP-N-acetylmuramoyl-tripeptide--D-alanyl-D- alanine ligase n=1 Tax=Thermoleptolyngbya sp. C42_A2020_037 TaxID=2747799 RepID=UPI0019ED8258|nr:UDP-N-acetylmuramoyl-tripeptide--D-alanyl-D-alanine ligase [Thermoleptolyngbya sp. C42_A2020_037]MBF2084686.1 UDP-N-acetylmuramoyl-tripeptide--D-alanyl-D-alanine ligase [Thermoleptolyngbya sp. C42_A2020_037]
MPFSMPLSRLAQNLGARLHEWSEPVSHTPIAQVTTDSRSLEPGDLFLALRGDRFDGHAFVKQALAQGAIAAVVSDLPPDATGPVLQVSDTLVAYQQLGTLWRRQFSGPVVAITGSVGKTTTKELIAAVLATRGPVLKTRANHNNEIGVPKTLLELGPEHQFAVIEMGMRAAGEIALLGQIAEPDIAVITNVGTAHIGRLGSEQAIADAKCELLQELDSAGAAVLNHDNLRLMDTAARVWRGKTITYGLEGGDLRGELVDAHTLRVDDTLLPLPLPGRHNALNYLAALAVAKLLGLSWQPLMAGLTVELPQGRARRLDLPNDVVILDETYNAGLESMLAALRLLADTPGARRIAVLGTMKELGDRSLEFHQQVGAAVQDLKLDALLILADPAEAEALAVGASGIPTERFTTHAEVVDWLRQNVTAGDRLLFKASRAVGLDQVVSRFLDTP